MKPSRKYYNIAEAAEVLPYSESDLWHFIKTGQLVPDLLSPKRRYLFIVWDQNNKRLVANSTCQYYGLLRVHHSWIDSLLVRKEIILTKWATPLDASHISSFEDEYPFGDHEPPADLIWDEEACPAGGALRLMPLPKIQRSALYTVGKLLENGLEKASGGIATGDDDIGQVQMPEIFKKEYVYSYAQMGRFTIDDLCISPEMLASLEPTFNGKQDNNALVIDPDCSQPPDQSPANRPPLKRTDAMGELLWRVLSQHPDISAKECISLLEHEIDAEVPQYDLDSIVVSVDVLAVEWRDQKGREKTLKLASLANRLSTLRARMKEKPN